LTSIGEAFVTFLLVLVAGCDRAGPEPQFMRCVLDKPRMELDQFLLDISTGTVTTGLENVCCDRALSMVKKSASIDGHLYRAQYETTLDGYLVTTWYDVLTIHLDTPGDAKPFELLSLGAPGDINPFELLSEEVNWTGLCAPEPSQDSAG